MNNQLASYAANPDNSKGRLYPEGDCKYRSTYGRDRDKIINCNSFRRLQYKTQVFVNNKGDHYRTRLTHSLEVAQIARWISDALNCNKDLAEVISLAHDLGHTAFGHAGEEILNKKMQPHGGFSHNAHALTLVTFLEKSYIEFPGLNLSWEMLEGVVKHNGPVLNPGPGYEYVLSYNEKHDLKLKSFPSIEAQISAISDDIAYNNHDIEDGLRAGLFALEDLFNLPIVGEKFHEIHQKQPEIRHDLLMSCVKRDLTNAMVLDVVATTKINLEKNNIKTANNIRHLGKFLVEFSPKMQEAHLALKQFLRQNMYFHPLVQSMSKQAEEIIGGLFDFYMQKPDSLPPHHQISSANKKEMAINIANYIAGMTDRFAFREFQKIN